MRELALFAGAGGGILGGVLLGWRTVCAVEIDAYAASVLLQRQNDGILPPFPLWDDIRTFDGREWKGIVDVVSGGFPCQDISAAGRGAGIGGERSGLWREMARVVREVGPQYVFVENSPMLTSRGLDVVLGDLAAMGYDAEWGVLGAVHAGAPHRRERIWILANANSRRCWPERIERGLAEVRAEQPNERMQTEESSSDVAHAPGEGSPSKPSSGLSRGLQSGPGKCRENVADTESGGQPVCGRSPGETGYADKRSEDVADTEVQPERTGLREDEATGKRRRRPSDGSGEADVSLSGRTRLEERQGSAGERAHPTTAGGGWWSAQPGFRRVVNGIPARVDRLKACGNGQVPAVAALAWETLKRRAAAED